MELWAWIGAAVVVALVCGGLGAYIATEKGRSDAEGFVIGVLLGPLGLLIEVLLPTVERPAPKRSTPRRSPWETDPEPDDPAEDAAYDFLRGLK